MSIFTGCNAYSDGMGIFINIFAAEIVCSKYIIDDINIAELFVPHIIVCKSNAVGTFTAKNPARGINIQFQISYDNAG